MSIDDSNDHISEGYDGAGGGSLLFSASVHELLIHYICSSFYVTCKFTIQ